ncbi:MAG: hypothetical protein WA005_12665 [Candidatus Binataceae bacterium]
MKISRFVFICIAIIALTAPAWSQPAGPSAAMPGIPGYLDARSGAFKPMVINPVETPDVAELTPTGGKFVFNFTITIASPVPAGDVIQCGAGAEAFDGVRFFDESASFVTATRSGSSATCKVTIPYSWSLATASSDSVSLSYTVTTGAPTTGSAGQLTYRYSSGDLAAIKVPAPGVTTTENVSVTF